MQTKFPPASGKGLHPRELMKGLAQLDSLLLHSSDNQPFSIRESDAMAPNHSSFLSSNSGRCKCKKKIMRNWN